LGTYKDNQIAYMWYGLAASNGSTVALTLREFAEADMTPDEITQAKQMIRDWKLGDYPSAEHRLGGCRDRELNDRICVRCGRWATMSRPTTKGR
jgi:hypothetical protein